MYSGVNKNPNPRSNDRRTNTNYNNDNSNYSRRYNNDNSNYSRPNNNDNSNYRRPNNNDNSNYSRQDKPPPPPPITSAKPPINQPKAPQRCAFAIIHFGSNPVYLELELYFFKMLRQYTNNDIIYLYSRSDSMMQTLSYCSKLYAKMKLHVLNVLKLV